MADLSAPSPSPSSPQGAPQWIRRCGLAVTSNSKALDLSDFRIKFRVYAPDFSHPPTANIRVYNLARPTAQKIVDEFQEVILEAGYRNGNFGGIFKGTIMQIRRGRESATDDFVDILAADGDQFHNYGFINKTLKSGSNGYQQMLAIKQVADEHGIEAGSVPEDKGGTGGSSSNGGIILPRGKVMFGMSAQHADTIANSNQWAWNIEDGKLNITPYAGYAPGEIVALNSRTGLIGVPEATLEGIMITCLLNPKIKVAGRVKIAEKDIVFTTIKNRSAYPGYSDVGSLFQPNVGNDGIYRVLVKEHIGDTRGNEWYTNLVCLALDGSAPAGSQVQGVPKPSGVGHN